MNVPLEVAMLLCGVFCAAGAWIGKRRAVQKLAKQRDRLSNLMQPATLDPVIDLAARRNAMREASHAVLHGRIDRLGRAATHDGVTGSVASVMRAGLRRGDRVTHIDGEGFTIILPGVDERAGARIADRLHHALYQAGAKTRFGVAAGRSDDGGDLLNRRARRALDATLTQGRDHIVSASEIEEVFYLPAPEAVPTASAA